MHPAELGGCIPMVDALVWTDIVRGRNPERIAEKYGYSKYYIAQLRKLIPHLQNAPRLVDKKVVCLYCGKSGKLVIHHNHGTGECIGLICPSCNAKPENQISGKYNLPPLQGDRKEGYPIFFRSRTVLNSK
jgi:hypothetical protein